MTATFKVGLQGPSELIRRSASARRPPEVAAALRGVVPALDDIFAALAKATSDLNSAKSAAIALERGDRPAAAKDAAAFAEARRNGDKDPGAVHVEEHARRLTDAQRQWAGMRQVIRDLNRDLGKLLEAHGGQLVAALLSERSGFHAEQAEHEAAALAAAQGAKRIEIALEWLQRSGAGMADDDADD